MAGRRRSGARPPADSQHFLRDPRLAAQLVREAGVGSRDLVVDIGAGSGRLTAELSRTARRVLAIEQDRRWAAQLDGRWPNVRVLEADVLAIALPREDFTVVANLPFDKTTRDPAQAVRRPGEPPRPRGSRRRVGRRDATRAAVAEPREEHRLGLDVRDRRHATAAPRRVRPGAARRCRRRLVPAPRDCRSSRSRRTSGSIASSPSGFRRGLHTVAPPRKIEQLAGRGATARDLDAHQWAQLFLRG